MRVRKQMLTTTVGHVACCLEVQMNRNIGLGVKFVMHGSIVTVSITPENEPDKYCSVYLVCVYMYQKQ